MKRLLVVLLCLAPAVASAQSFLVEQKIAEVAYAYDVTSAGYTYCRYLGVQQDPFGTPIPGPRLIKTSGSSATVTSATTGDNAFAEVAVGDILFIAATGTTTPTTRVVTARASADSITVDSVITLAGNTWGWKKQSCGTGITDGWIPVGKFYNLAAQVEYVTKNATSVDFSFECKQGNVSAAAAIIDQTAMTATGVYSRQLASGVFDSCRLGLKITGDGGAQSVFASLGYKR